MKTSFARIVSLFIPLFIIQNGVLHALTVYNAEGDTIGHTMCVAVYDYYCRTSDSEGNAKTVSCGLTVQVGKEVACSMGLALHDGIRGAEKVKEQQQFVPLCYQNYPKGQLTALETMPFNRFKTEEKMDAMRWDLLSEQDSVCGFACQKASCTYYGRQWTVWFTKDIPSQTGPWRLHGLPGLILKAEADSTHLFVCRELRREKEPIVFRADASYAKTAHKKFVKYRNAKLLDEAVLKDPNYLLRTVSLDDVVVLHGLPFINGIPAMDSSTRYQPLEKE